MKNYILLCFGAFFTHALNAQLSLNFETGDILPTVSGTVYQGGTCGSVQIEGVEGSSRIDLEISFVKGIEDIPEMIINKNPNPFTIDFTPTFSCSYNLLHASGRVNAYLVSIFSPCPF